MSFNRKLNDSPVCPIEVGVDNRLTKDGMDEVKSHLNKWFEDVIDVTCAGLGKQEFSEDTFHVNISSTLNFIRKDAMDSSEVTWPFPSQPIEEPNSILEKARLKIERAIGAFEDHLDLDDGLDASDAIEVMNELKEFLPKLDNAIQAERNK